MLLILLLSDFGFFNFVLMTFSSFVLLNVIMESICIGYSFKFIQCDFNITNTQEGLLGAASFLGIIVSSHLWGLLADTLGRKRIMQPTLFLSFLVTVIASFSPNYEILISLRFLGGIL